MRIAFLGKGGAGKTTISAGFIEYLSKHKQFVLAIDADVNAHLREALRISKETRYAPLLGDSIKELTQYLCGDRTDIGSRPIIASTPPARGSKFILVEPSDNTIKKYSVFKNNVALISVGKYKESDVGDSCYHSKLNALAVFLHHLLDGQNDYVVADTTAGTDNVATTLSFAYDMNVFIVEPTLKSINVYNDFINIAPHLKNHTFIIANKIIDPQDELFVLEHIDKKYYLGAISLSPHLKQFEQGNIDALSSFQQKQETLFDQILEQWQKIPRNWDLYLELLRETHVKACLSWANSMYETDLINGLDSSFRYEDLIKPSITAVA